MSGDVGELFVAHAQFLHGSSEAFFRWQVEQDVRAQQAQARQNSGENRAAAREPSEAERNRPTVNTSGQVVGTRINTTA